MPEQVHPDGRAQPEHPEVQHEPSDVSVRGILWFAGGLTVLAIVIHIVLWGLFVYFDGREKKTKQTDFPLVGRPQPQWPPPPQLEGISPTHRGRPGELVARPPAQEMPPLTEEMIRKGLQLPARPEAEKKMQEPEMPSGASSGRIVDREQ